MTQQTEQIGSTMGPEGARATEVSITPLLVEDALDSALYSLFGQNNLERGTVNRKKTIVKNMLRPRLVAVASTLEKAISESLQTRNMSVATTLTQVVHELYVDKINPAALSHLEKSLNLSEIIKHVLAAYFKKALQNTPIDTFFKSNEAQDISNDEVINAFEKAGLDELRGIQSPLNALFELLGSVESLSVEKLKQFREDPRKLKWAGTNLGEGLVNQNRYNSPSTLFHKFLMSKIEVRPGPDDLSLFILEDTQVGEATEVLPPKQEMPVVKTEPEKQTLENPLNPPNPLNQPNPQKAESPQHPKIQVREVYDASRDQRPDSQAAIEVETPDNELTPEERVQLVAAIFSIHFPRLEKYLAGLQQRAVDRGTEMVARVYDAKSRVKEGLLDREYAVLNYLDTIYNSLGLVITEGASNFRAWKQEQRDQGDTRSLNVLLADYLRSTREYQEAVIAMGLFLFVVAITVAMYTFQYGPTMKVSYDALEEMKSYVWESDSTTAEAATDNFSVTMGEGSAVVKVNNNGEPQPTMVETPLVAPEITDEEFARAVVDPRVASMSELSLAVAEAYRRNWGELQVLMWRWFEAESEAGVAFEDTAVNVDWLTQVALWYLPEIDLVTGEVVTTK